MRCSDYLGALFNWDANTISFQQGRQNRMSMSQAKNLVLEMIYSISHRVSELLQHLWNEIRLYPVIIEPSHDPATVSCVLWILYSSLSSFMQLEWKKKKTKHLVGKHTQQLINLRINFVTRTNSSTCCMQKQKKHYHPWNITEE
jgi:hypothetical protein